MEGHLNRVFTFMHKVSVTHRDLKTPEIGVGGFRNIVWCGNFCEHFKKTMSESWYAIKTSLFSISGMLKFGKTCFCHNPNYAYQCGKQKYAQ